MNKCHRQQAAGQVARRPTARFDNYGDELRICEVSEITGLSMSHLYEAAKSGWLEPISVTVGKRLIRVPKAALRRILEGDVQ